MKVTLEYVNNEKKVSKAGKQYTACSIKVNGEFYNGFGNKQTESWSAGQEVELELYEEMYNGKNQKKFRTVDAKEVAQLEANNKLEEILERVKNIESLIRGGLQKSSGSPEEFQNWLDNPTK